MSIAYTPRPISVQQAAQPPKAERACVIELSHAEAVAVASALLAMSVSYFGASDRAELSGDFSRADALRFDGVTLSRVEIAVRNATR